MARPFYMNESVLDWAVQAFKDEAYIESGKICFNKYIQYPKKDLDMILVKFTPIAYAKVQRLILGFESEVGWHGTVYRDEDTFVIDDIFVYPQEVTGVTVTPNDKEYTQWSWDLPDDTYNNLRLHGHSHVDMPVTPSGIDMEFANKIVDQLEEGQFYIFMIMNKSGDIHCRVYDYDKNVMYETEDVEVVIPEALDTDWFFKDAQELVQEEKLGYGYNKNKKGDEWFYGKHD